MDAFDADQERKSREKQAAMGEDGWTVVVRAKVRAESGRGCTGAIEVYRRKEWLWNAGARWS